MEHKRISLKIDSELANVALIGAAVNRLCEFSSLPRDQVNRLELAVVEAVNNSIEHAYGYVSGNTIEVEFSLSEDDISVTIHDTGNSMPPSAVSTITGGPKSIPSVEGIIQSELPECGWGLLLIKSLTDDVSYATVNGRNSLKMTYRVEREAVA